MYTDSKDSEETITVTFDFSDYTEDAVISPTVAVTLESGTDATPSAILSGSPQISGNQVLQMVVGGAVGAKYHLRCTAETSDGMTYVVAGILPVTRF